MFQVKHLLCSLAVLAMATAQSTSLSITIDAKSTSEVQTSYTITDTAIAVATGSPPPVASTTIHAASTLATPTASPSPTSKPSNQFSVPVIAGIAAGSALLLVATVLIIIITCLRRRRFAEKQWPNLPREMAYHSDTRPVSIRRPSSAATLVPAPAQAYVHSKGSMEYARGMPRHSKSFKSSHSTILERVSEEAANEFTFDFGVPPEVEVIPPVETEASNVVQVNEHAFQRLVMDKSLPSSPEHEIPMTVLDLGNYQAENGKPRSSIYSTATGQERERDSQGYF